MSTSRRLVNYRLRGERSEGLGGLKATTSVDERIADILRDKDQSSTPATILNGESRLRLDDVERRSPNPSAENSKRVTVLIADNHPVVREGLVALIDRRADMHVIAEASNGREAVDKFVAQRPDVALVDLRMPLMDGIETIVAICEKDPGAQIVVITSYNSEEDIYRALRAGARGYVLKDAGIEELIECIHAVHSGKTWIPPQVGSKLAKRVANRQLTPRETDVLQAVAVGKSNKEIGVAFNISEATVKVHMTHILEKLSVTGRTEAINVAVKRGLVRMEGATGA